MFFAYDQVSITVRVTRSATGRGSARGKSRIYVDRNRFGI